MKYLCRLITPKNGTVLDPFMGSGSTGKAAILEGYNFIGIELSEEYLDIARNRINTNGSFPRPNTGVSAQMIRFDEGGSITFYMMNSAGAENTVAFDTGGNAYKPGGGSWSANSDIRLKNNVRDYNKGTAELMQIRVREWEHNGKGGIQAGYKGLGVVADEIELVLPGTVHTYEGKLNPEDEETTDIKSVNATEITWLLVKTVQEQQAKIEALTARLEALES
jgi:hypothetical protein